MDDIAAMHYLVERIESDSLSTMRRVAWQAASPFGGMPLIRNTTPDPNRPMVLHEAGTEDVRRNARGDIVRIVDRGGNVGWWREFVSREAGIRMHSEIMDDLMKLDVLAFRGKYAIIPERPAGVAAPPDAASERTQTTGAEPGTPATAPADPWGAWGQRVRRSEGGTDWAEPQRPGDPDIGWDGWGQR